MLKQNERVELYYRDKWQTCICLVGEWSVIFRDIKTERQVCMKTHAEVEEYKRKELLKTKK